MKYLVIITGIIFAIFFIWLDIKIQVPFSYLIEFLIGFWTMQIAERIE